MPQKSNEIWQHFTKSDKEKGGTCNYCGHRLKTNELVRLRKHLTSASCGADTGIKRKYAQLQHFSHQLQHNQKLEHPEGPSPKKPRNTIKDISFDDIFDVKAYVRSISEPDNLLYIIDLCTLQLKRIQKIKTEADATAATDTNNKNMVVKII